MGFWNKLVNLFKGRGFKEEEDATEEKLFSEEDTKVEPKYPEEVKIEKEVEEEEKLPSQLPEQKEEPVRKGISISEASKSIKREGVGRVEIQQQIGDLNSMIPTYEKLLKNKVTDPAILDYLTHSSDFRKRFKNRFSCTYDIYIDGKLGGVVKGIGILPEEMKSVSQNKMYEGLKVDSLGAVLRMISNSLTDTHGAVSSNYDVFIPKGTITRIVPKYEFA